MGSEMCIRDRPSPELAWSPQVGSYLTVCTCGREPSWESRYTQQRRRWRKPPTYSSASSRRSTPSITELMELTLTKRPSNTAHRGGLKGALRLAHGICIWNMLHIHGGERQRGKPSQAVALTVSLSPFPLSLTLTAYAPQLSSRLVAPHGASNLSFTYTDTHVTIQLCSCCIWSPHLTT